MPTRLPISSPARRAFWRGQEVEKNNNLQQNIFPPVLTPE
jgi:hypothetical protein